MAVKITIYGKAELKEFENARAEIDRLEKEALRASNGFAGHMARMGDSITAAGQKMTSVGDSMTKNVTLPILAVGAGLFKAAQGAREAELTSAKLKNVLGSMGYADQAARVDAYAEKLEGVVAVDADVIKTTQMKLATFAGLAQTVDKAGGAFDRATMAALDMAAAGFGTAEGNAVQLGKALDNPIKGVTALAKSGVTFTESEKAKIKALQESGDLLGAQNIVLKAIEKQVGGTAKAGANDFEKMKLQFAKVSDALGTAVLPLITQFAEVLTTKIVPVVVPAIEGISKAFGSLPGPVKGGIVAVAGIAAAMGPVLSITGRVTQAFGSMTSMLAANPFLLWIAGIAALVAGVIYAYNHWTAFREKVQPIVEWFGTNAPIAFEKVKQVAEAVVMWFQQAWVKWGDDILRVASVAWSGIKSAVETTITVVRGVIEGFISVVQAAWSLWGDNLIAYVRIAWETMRGVVEGALKVIQGVIQTVTSLIHGDWSGAWEGIKKIVTGAFEMMVAYLRGMVSQMANAAAAIWDAIKVAASAAWDGIKALFRAELELVVGVIRGAWNAMKSAGQHIVDGFKAGAEAAWHLVKAAFSDLVEGIKTVFVKAPTMLLQAGKDLISGLWNGIVSKGTEFAANISRWIEDHIPGPVRKLMGIESPSRVMHEIGGHVIQGLINGIFDRLPFLHDTSTDMADTVIRTTKRVTDESVKTVKAGTVAVTSMAGEAARNGKVYQEAFTSMAGEAARTGQAFRVEFAAMAGEAARTGTAIATRFGALAGEAARNGTALVDAGTTLGRRMGTAIADGVSDTITDVEDYFKQFAAKMSKDYGVQFGSVGGGVAGGSISVGPGGSPSMMPSNLNINDLYGQFGGTYGDWARQMLVDLQDWNRKVGNTDVQVNPFAPNPFTGGTLTDRFGNGVALNDLKGIQDALAYQQQQNGPQVTVQAGAIQVNVNGSADPAATKQAVNDALDDFAMSLGAL